MKSKKIVIPVIALVLIAIAIIAIFAIRSINYNPDLVYNEAESQTDITVDSWLKISSVTEKDGKLCAIVENVSDQSIEYALLTVMCGDEKLSFNVSVLPTGAKAFLLCNEDARLKKNSSFINWSISDKIILENLSLHEDVFTLTSSDGSVGIKNITDKDISGNIYIVYKEKADGIINGSQTHRIRLAGIEKNSQTYIKADGFLKDKHEIIFIDYDN